MTEPTTTPAETPKPTKTRKAPAKKVEFAPLVKLSDEGKTRLDHAECGHSRTPAGRAACRAEYAKKNAK